MSIILPEKVIHWTAWAYFSCNWPGLAVLISVRSTQQVLTMLPWPRESNMLAIKVLLLFLSVRRKESNKAFPGNLALTLALEFRTKVQGSLAQSQMFLLVTHKLKRLKINTSKML